MMLTGCKSYWEIQVTSKYLLGVIYIFLLELSGSEESFQRSRNNLTASHSGWEARIHQRHSLTPPILSQNNAIPQFRSPSLKLLVQRGDRILLPCIVHDLGEDHILWRHQSNILAGSNISSYFDDSGRIRLFENFTLEISEVSAADDGEYECFLASPSSSLKLTHTVTVQDPPTVTILPAKGSVVVVEGETVQIGCIPQGRPKPRITWTKRDGPIPWSHQKLFNESIITMEQVSRKHTGLYVCSADNGVGLPGIGAVYVRVLHTPEVEVPKRRIHGGVGYKAHLICIVHADPKPQVQWYLGQKPVPLSERIVTEARDKMYTLVINVVRESDFGMYMCTANNSLGFDLRHIEFSGKNNRDFLADGMYKAGTNELKYVFLWGDEGVPNPPVVNRWETLSMSAPGAAGGEPKDDQVRLVVRQRQNGNSNTNSTRSPPPPPPLVNENAGDKTGHFSSELQNDVQVQLLWAVECYSPLIDYRLAFRPAPTKPLTSQNEDKTPLWTELTIPADPSSTFLHTKSFLLRGLQQQTIYESAIKARNKYGWSPISTVFYFSTFPNSSSLSAPGLEEYIAENALSEDGTRKLFTHPTLLGRQNESWTKNQLSLSTSSGASGISKDIITILLLPILMFGKLFPSVLITISSSVMTALHISNVGAVVHMGT